MIFTELVLLSKSKIGGDIFFEIWLATKFFKK